MDYARGQGPILVHGRRTRFLELCMDQSIIDVTGIPCKVGDEVTLIGQDGDERISVYSIEKRTGRTFDAAADLHQRPHRAHLPLKNARRQKTAKEKTTRMGGFLSFIPCGY